jgi:hypothetical protein
MTALHRRCEGYLTGMTLHRMSNVGVVAGDLAAAACAGKGCVALRD